MPHATSTLTCFIGAHLKVTRLGGAIPTGGYPTLFFVANPRYGGESPPMPLTNCPDCGNDISTEAYVCPKCGRPTGRRPKYPLKRFAILWTLLIVVFFALWQFLSPK